MKRPARGAGIADASTARACMAEIPFQHAPEPQPVDLNVWPRADHFAFYCGFQEPFFSLVAEVACGALVRACKERGESPTLRLWHAVLRAANEVEAFRYRIVDDRPVLFSRIHLSPTVARPDETFAIAFLPFLDEFEPFREIALPILEAARLSRGFKLDAANRRIDLIHFSTLPWFRFSALTHARHMGHTESEPKITLGRFGERDGELWLPVSVTVHHGLVDGLHISYFLRRLEALLSGSENC